MRRPEERARRILDGAHTLHWDGTSWTKGTSGTTNSLFAVFGNAAEVWAAGEKGTLLRCNVSSV
ncbi:MAG: hypothetical protein U1A78_39540 [Polyangia bacterium]